MFRGFLFRNFVICSEKQRMGKQMMANQMMGKIISKRILKTILYVYKEIKYT